jgi:hypothetical protein
MWHNVVLWVAPGAVVTTAALVVEPRAGSEG